MTNKPKTTTTPKRKIESYADWMARIDASVEKAVQACEKAARTAEKTAAVALYAGLHPAQKRLVQMLMEHLRTLPKLSPNEDPIKKPEYDHVNGVVVELFLAAYPAWEKAPRHPKSGQRLIENIPGDGRQLCEWILTNCGGSPIRKFEDAEDEL